MDKRTREWIEGEIQMIIETFDNGEDVSELEEALARFTAGTDTALDRGELLFQIDCKLGAEAYDEPEELAAAEAAEAALIKAGTADREKITVDKKHFLALVAACDDMLSLADTMDGEDDRKDAARRALDRF